MSAAPLTIAFVSREYPPSARMGGIARYVQEIATALASRGHRVHVVCASDDGTSCEQLQDGNVTVHRLPGADFFIVEKQGFYARLRNKVVSLTRFHSYRLAVAQKLLEIRSDNETLIVEGPDFGAELLPSIVQRPNGIVFVTRLHGPTSLNRASGDTVNFHSSPLAWLMGKRERLQMLNSDSLSSPSAAMTKWTRDNLLVRRPVCTIHNFIDAQFWQEPTSIVRRPGLLLFAGTVVESKGCAELVAAARHLRMTLRPDIRLMMVGRGGSYANQLRAQLVSSGEIGPNGWIEMTGAVSKDQLRDWYRLAHVCVFPSWWEPFGLVCLEAMASGAVVVGSTAGGMAEIISNGENGYLAEPRNFIALSNAIRQALEISAEEFLLLQRSSAKLISEKFSLTSCVRKIEVEYERVIEQAKSLC